MGQKRLMLLRAVLGCALFIHTPSVCQQVKADGVLSNHAGVTRKKL
jgi:hypothetical protein